MGMYTQLKVKCKLKPEFVSVIQKLEQDNANWETCEWGWETIALAFPEYSFLKEWSSIERADFIPFGSYASFSPTHSLVGDVWEFHCTMKNYGGVAQKFYDMVLKNITESIDYAETWYEEDMTEDYLESWKPLKGV